MEYTMDDDQLRSGIQSLIARAKARAAVRDEAMPNLKENIQSLIAQQKARAQK
jgi:hypothetical protein